MFICAFGHMCRGRGRWRAWQACGQGRAGWVTVAEAEGALADANKGASFKDVFRKGESRHGNG